MPERTRPGPAPTRAWPRPDARLAAPLLGLATLLLASAAAATLPAGGRLSITVEQAVPFDASDYPKANRHTQPDLHLTLPLDDEGSVGPRGWAWFDAMPAVEHPVVVNQAGWEGDTLRLELAVEFRHNVPLHTGGTGTYQLTLTRTGDLLRGEFSGKVEGLDKAKQAELWVSLDPQFKATSPAWRGGLHTGEVASLLRVPLDKEHLRITAHGRIEPAPQGRRDTPQPGLLFPRGKADALGRGDALKALTALLDAGASGSLVEGDGVTCDGYAAAGYAVLAAAGADKDALAKSADAARRAVEAVQTAEPHRLARELMGLAVAYDVIGARWDAGTRHAVQAVLINQAVRLSATQMPATLYDTHVGPNGVLGSPRDAADYRLAMLRGSAGLAALAVRFDDLDAAQPARVGEALAVCVRSLERFCRAGIGDGGAGNTNHGCDEALETVLPFLLAYRNVTGIDLAAGTGADRVAAWGAVSGGLAFDEAGHSAWRSAAALIAGAHDRALVAHALAQAPGPANPLQAILHGLATASPGDAGAAAALPTVWQDTRMGAFVLRHGEGADGFTLLAESAARPAQAWPARGRVAFRGLGRDWLAPSRAPLGAFDWPDYRRQNRFQVYESLMTERGPAIPHGSAKIMRRRAARDGSGSVAFKGYGWANYNTKTGQPGQEIEAKYSYDIRTVGVDYSGASGADALLVFVESQRGLDDRQRVWQANVGPLAPEAVKIDGMSFTIEPGGGTASMRGVVLYPPTASIEYLPPPASDPAAPGRLRVHMIKPGPGMKELFDKSMNDTVDALRLMQNDDPDKMDVEFEDFKIEFFTEDYPKENKQQLNDDANVIFNKHIRVVTSNSMGGPNVYPTARNGFVLVLTVDAAGDHPPVEVLPAEDQAMFKIGDQQVTYWEYLVDFKTKGGK